MNGSESEPGASAPIGSRLPGCSVGIIFGIALMSLAIAWLEGLLPPLALSLGGVVFGVSLTRVYAVVAERRWGAEVPDTVQMLVADLRMVRLRSPDYRFQLLKTAPLSERALHEALYVLKWIGNVFLIAGLGAAMYLVMVALGFVEG